MLIVDLLKKLRSSTVCIRGVKFLENIFQALLLVSG